MGKHFGELAYIRGIVYFILSPHEQKPFAGAFKYGIPNCVNRTLPTIRYWLPPLLLGWLIYTGVEEKYRLSKRKNWKDYLNEVPPPPEPEPEPEPEVCVKKEKKKPPPPVEVDPCCPKWDQILPEVVEEPTCK